jgi:hypothetical protein
MSSESGKSSLRPWSETHFGTGVTVEETVSWLLSVETQLKPRMQDTKMKTNNNFFKYFKKIWVNVECFNVFSSKNVVSYFWVADYSNKYYGVPNYLTPFQLNAKLTVEF